MRRLFVLLPMLVLASAAAMADGLEINWREARVVRLAKPATSVVVGDPTVVDVTLDNPTTVVVFGKTPGETNLLVLSGSDEMLIDWPVIVTPVNSRHVSVVNAQGTEAPMEVLYACGAERCTRVLSPTEIQFQASSSTSTQSNSDASKSTAQTEEKSTTTTGNTTTQTTTTGQGGQ